MRKKYDSLQEKLEALSIPEPNSGCWLWTRAVNKDGYGLTSWNGVHIRAHRASLQIKLGRPLEADECACHHCDNPPCVNPDHLWVGTPGDNARDRDKKGRTAQPPRGDSHWTRLHPERVARGDRHGSHTCPESLPRGDRHFSKTNPEKVARGERVSSAKLTATQVRDIRALCSTGVTHRAVAAMFGVAQPTVSRIVRRELWKHVD